MWHNASETKTPSQWLNCEHQDDWTPTCLLCVWFGSGLGPTWTNVRGQSWQQPGQLSALSLPWHVPPMLIPLALCPLHPTSWQHKHNRHFTTFSAEKALGMALARPLCCWESPLSGGTMLTATFLHCSVVHSTSLRIPLAQKESAALLEPCPPSFGHSPHSRVSIAASNSPQCLQC